MKLTIQNLKDIPEERLQKIKKRSAGSYVSIIPEVQKIINEVRTKGDASIYKKYWARIDKKKYQSIKVTPAEIKAAYKQVDKGLINALKQAAKNITAVHTAQLPKKKDVVVQPESGIKVWREWRAIEKVGLYIPGGKAIYPSSVLMSAIPAQIAGCKQIVITSPPNAEGTLPAPTLVAADLIGVTEIFKIGGAQAVAALAYGTESVPNVYKIFGAGNSYVTAAKLLVLKDVSIDMPAGPSEVFIIADETAKPSYIAADLLADGEHGEDSACVLLTTSKKIAEQTIEEISKQLQLIKTRKRAEASLQNYGLIALVKNLDEALNFCNEYAPEHLEIMTKNDEAVVRRIQNAGSVFLGNWTTKSSGDYATGANHVLPTGGMAKMYPPLGVDAYGKWMQVQKCTKSGLQAIQQTLETLAQTEGLPAHKLSSSVRFLK